MKKILLTAFAISLVVAIVLTPFVAHAQAAGGASKPAGSGPGAALAQTITTVTGIAISPLLAMSAIGAWQFFRESEKRNQLPFYAQWWFWLPGLLIAGAAALKDVFGAATPPGLKKPLDMVELLENKVSGLVAAGALVPLVMGIFHTMKSFDAGGGLAGAGFAAIGGAEIMGVLTLPLALAVYVVVWLVSHSINVLILLSPWGGLDAALKAARTAVLGSLALMGSHNPVWGACLSAVVILIAWALAGWSFRLMIFGNVFVWDFFTGKRKRLKPQREARAFTARKLEKVPIRTWGRLVPQDDGTFTFYYKPWLVLKERVLEVPAGKLAIGNAFLYPSLVRLEGDRERNLFNFPPRYRTHEAELAKLYGITVCDIGLIKGFKAAWRWLKDLLGAGTHPIGATA